MANTTISPNMGLIIPTVGVDPGPDWANNINADLSIIDGHNHTTGDGVQITPAGININADLPFNGNNATTLRSARFTAQSAPLSLGTDVGCLYESGVDLYYNDGSGNQIRITASGSVTGSAGTITGLPSGTASAAYSGGTFTFESATSTPAAMNVGPTSIGLSIANSHTITLQPTSGIAADYTLSLPAVAPTANQVMVSDGSGNLTWTRGLLPLGAVIGIFPNLSGAYSTSNTTTADANGFVLCAGQTISDSSSPMNGAIVPNINNSIFLVGSTSSGSSGGVSSGTLTINNLPSHTHGAGSYATSLTGSFAATSHTHGFPHVHQYSYWNATGGVEGAGGFYSPASVSSSFYGIGSFTSSTSGVVGYTDGLLSTGATSTPIELYKNSPNSNQSLFTTGPTRDGSTVAVTQTESADASLGGSNSVTGSSGAVGSGTSFDITPPYISTVYLMRIK